MTARDAVHYDLRIVIVCRLSGRQQFADPRLRNPAARLCSAAEAAVSSFP